MKRNACLILALIFIFGCSNWLFVAKGRDGLNAGMKAIQKGNDLYLRGCYRASLENYFKAHEIFTANDRLVGVALSLNNIGNVYRATGEADSALLFYDEAYATYKRIKDRKGMLRSLSNKAAALIGSGRYDEAQTALDAADRVSGREQFVPLLTNRGLLFIKTSRFEAAEKVLTRAYVLADPDDNATFATLNYVFGGLMADIGRNDEALKYFQTALAADKKAGFHKGIADDLKRIGSVYLKQKNYDAAVDAWERSIKVYALLGDGEETKSLLSKLTDAAEKTDIDITVTTHFVKQWLKGRVYMPPCE